MTTEMWLLFRKKKKGSLSVQPTLEEEIENRRVTPAW